MDIRSLGYRTDLMIRALEGSQVTDRGDHLVVRTPQNPSYWWGNFLLLSRPPQPDPGAGAIRIYRSVGFTQVETQLGFERQP